MNYCVTNLCVILNEDFNIETRRISRLLEWCPARDLNPHACAPDPKSGVSANFTSRASFCRNYFYSNCLRLTRKILVKQLFYLNYLAFFQDRPISRS